MEDFETGIRRRYIGHGTWRYDKVEMLTAMISLQNLANKMYRTWRLFITRSYSQEAERISSTPPFLLSVDCGGQGRMCLFCAGPGGSGMRRF